MIGCIVYLGTKYQIRLEVEASKTFELLPVVLFSTIFPIVIGLFLRLPQLIIEIKEHTPWTFDWVKFIAVSIPCLYIMMFSLYPFLPIAQVPIKIPHFIMVGSPTIQIIAGVVFGYILLDSLKK